MPIEKKAARKILHVNGEALAFLTVYLYEMHLLSPCRKTRPLPLELLEKK